MAPELIVQQNDLNGHSSSTDNAQRLTTQFISDTLAGTLSIPRDFAHFGDNRGIAEASSDGEQPLKPALEHVAGYEPLPDGMLPEVPCDGVGAWLEMYTSYASAKSPMSPVLFHQSAGLVLASIATARRLVLPMGFDDIYPNLYILWVASSSLFRKTTALDIAADLARGVFPHLLTPQEYTPEALLADMAGEKPINLNGSDADPVLLKRWQAQRDFAAQRGGFYDEISGMLARAGKDYNAGLLEFIMKAYDCAGEYSSSTRSHGFLVAQHIYFSLIGPYARSGKPGL